MDFSLGEVERAVGELSQKIFRERVTPSSLKQTEAEPERFDRALWKDLASADLLGTSLPESAGGSDHGFLATCALLVEAGAAVAPVPLWPTLVLGAMPIVRFGSEDQQRRWLAGVAVGETILTAALVETGLDDATEPRMRARSLGGAWVLDGMKIASVSRYADIPMLRLTGFSWNDCAICGSAVAITLPSSSSMKNAHATIAAISH